MSKSLTVSTVFFIVTIIAVLHDREYLFTPEHIPPLTIGFIGILFFLCVAVYFYIRPPKRPSDSSELVQSAVASKQLFIEMFENSPVPYMLVDRSGVIVFPNIAAVRLLGAVREQLAGKNIFNLVDSENATHFALIPLKLEKGIFINNEEVHITRPDGSFRWANLSAFPFTDEEGRKSGLVTLIDITKQKEVDQVKTEFVSLASHQLRTPISSLKWNIELLMSERSGELSEKHLSYAVKIERAIGRMDDLVADFLNVSQLELGTLVPSPKHLDLKDFFDTVLEEFKEKIENKQLVIETDFSTSIETLLVDKRLFRMTVSNLISNAVKYTPEGGAILLKYAGNERHITITVSDTGMGVPKEDQEHLFTKLFRAHNVREQVPDGTGLGLYVVLQAVKVMGGSISFSSEENVGTTFEVVLPR